MQVASHSVVINKVGVLVFILLCFSLRCLSPPNEIASQRLSRPNQRMVTHFPSSKSNASCAGGVQVMQKNNGA